MTKSQSSQNYFHNKKNVILLARLKVSLNENRINFNVLSFLAQIRIHGEGLCMYKKGLK